MPAGGPGPTGQIQGDDQVASQEVGWANTLEDFALQDQASFPEQLAEASPGAAGYHTHEVTTRPGLPSRGHILQAAHPHNHPQTLATHL